MARRATGTVQYRGTPPRWWARITVRDAAGKTHRPWVDLERPDLKNDPADRAVAKRIALKRSRLAAKHAFVGRERAMAPRTKLVDLEDRWFALLDVDHHLKPSTRAVYRGCWTARIMPTWGDHTSFDLTVPALRAWVRELAEELSPSSVRNCAIAFTRFLTDARAEGWLPLDANPMRHEDVRAALPTVRAPDAEEIVHLSREQTVTLLASALPDDRFGLYLVALLTGLRAGELRGLVFAHLMLDAAIAHVRVRQQLGYAREAGNKPTHAAPKTRSSRRDVPLHPAARSWLTWWRDTGWASRYGRARTDDDPVFPAVDGEAGRPKDSGLLRRDLAAAGLPTEYTAPDGTRDAYTFHCLRRSFAHLLADAGVSVDIVSMLSGHAGKSVTERHYMGRSLDVMARAAAMIRLELPERPGVRAAETSIESSTAVEAAPLSEVKPLKTPADAHEHPIELPQFRHL